MIPIVGPPGSDAVISSPGAEEGYGHIMGPTFRNEMCARGTLRIALNRPVTLAAKVPCPAFVVIAEQDDIAPPEAVREVARRMGDRATVLSLPCAHFDIYVGDVFEQSVAAQVEFLQKVLN